MSMFSRSTRFAARQWNVRLQSTATTTVSASETATADGPAVTQTNRAEATLKRFWKTVDVEQRADKLAVTLDRRALKTPEGNTLLLPTSKRLVATLIAAEWEFQTTVIKHHALPVTSIVCRAIDAFDDEETRSQVCDALLTYLDTDTICFQGEEPEQLVKLQKEYWDPILEWVRNTYNVKVNLFESILSNSQPEETKLRLRVILLAMNKWELAALERVTHTTKSLLIALALVKEFRTVDEASRAARAEVQSQIDRWGEVEDTHDVDHHDIRRMLGSASSICHDV